ncbi:MAG TPA: septum site-determining protein Ssd [Mycobacteriales bacterium]
MAEHTSPRPLVVADDPGLVDDLLRLAAAASVEVEVAHDPVAARTSWNSAPMVLVGGALGAACARARMPRRPRVVLVGDKDATPETEAVWAVATELGAEHVVFLPAAEPWLVDRLADGGRPPANGVIVGIVGGRGGAGASVLAAGLAVTAVRCGLRALLVDADPYGGGLDLVVGGEDSAGLRWPDLAATTGRVSGQALYLALPRLGELSVLSWDRGDLLEIPPPAVDAVLDVGRQGSDLVVVDLPRRPDEAAVRVLQAADRVLLVVPAEVRASAAARRVVQAVAPHCADLQLVVRGPAPAGLSSRDLVAMVGLPLAGTMRAERGLPSALEHGEAPASRGSGQLSALCRKVLSSLDLPLGPPADDTREA